jgi:DNA-binding CsgD family transcriptional regulator
MNTTTLTIGQLRQQRDPDLDVLIPRLIKQEIAVAEYEELLNHIHPGFWRKMLRKAPNLTPMELRVCALTRLHLRTKESAKLLHLTTSSIESHRSHAREKLGLDSRINFASALHMI